MPAFLDILKAFKPVESPVIMGGTDTFFSLAKDSLAYENATKYLKQQGIEQPQTKEFAIKTAIEAGWKPAPTAMTAGGKKNWYASAELGWKPPPVKEPFVPPPGGEEFAKQWQKSGSVGGHAQPTAKQVEDYTTAYEQQGKKPLAGSFVDILKGKPKTQAEFEAAKLKPPTFKQVLQTKQPLAPSYEEQLAIAKKLQTAVAPMPKGKMQLPEGATIAVPQGWTFVGGQMGSNKGGLFADPLGQKWYVKNLQSADHAKNETMANELYRLGGADVPDLQQDGSQVRSKIVPDAITLKQLREQKGGIPLPVTNEIRKHFAADAWLGNWDVAGTGFDNILVDPRTGKTVRIDTGGTLKYRAQGQPKTHAGLYYTSDAEEALSMRDKGKNAPYAAKEAKEIFAGMTPDQLAESAARIAKIRPEEIADIVKRYGPSDPIAQKNLTKLLLRRRDNVVQRLTDPATPGWGPQAYESRKAAWAKGDPTMESWHGLGGKLHTSQLELTSEGGFWTTPSRKLARLYAASDKPFKWNLATGEQQGHMAEFVNNVADYMRVDAQGKSFTQINTPYIRKAREGYYPGLIIDNIWDEPSAGSKQLGASQTVVITLDPVTQRLKQARFDPAVASLNDLVASGAALTFGSAVAYSIFGTGEAKAEPGKPNIPMTDGQAAPPKFRDVQLGNRVFEVPAEMSEEEASKYIAAKTKQLDQQAGIPGPDTSFKGEWKTQEKEAGESIVSGLRAMLGRDDKGNPVLPEEPPEWVKRLAKDNGKEWTADEKRAWQQMVGGGKIVAGLFQAALSLPVAAYHSLIDQSNQPQEAKDAEKLILDTLTPAGGLGAAMKTSKFIKAAQASQSASKLGKVRDGIKAIVSPDKIDADSKSAAALIREKTGEAARETATSVSAVKEEYKGPALGALKNIWQNYERQINAMTPADQLRLIEYLQTRSKGAVLHDPELQAFADEFRNAMEQREIKLSQTPKLAATHMQEDYVSQYWKDPQAAAKFVQKWIAKQGSGAALKKKKWPTYADGIAAGLEPLTTNPIEIAARYVTSMDRFIAHTEVIEAGRAAGSVKFFTPGSKLAKSYEANGWVALDGHLARKQTPKGAVLQGYAPENWARPYNNFVSRGLYGASREWGNAYDAIRNASNALTQWTLGFSGFHLLNIAWEAVASPAALIGAQIGAGIGAATKGDILSALKLLGGSARTAATALTRPITGAVRGHKLEQIYLNRMVATRAFDKEIVDHFTKAGGRLGRVSSPDYTFSAAGSFFDAFKRGTLGKELKADFAGPGRLNKAYALGKQVGRIMQTVVQPLFDKYIPKMKLAAFSENMSVYLKANPLATDAEKAIAARKILDSIDNRFGELIQDNLFWSAGLRQAANLGLLAFSWTYGTIREVGGGMLAGVKNPRALSITSKDYDPRVGYIIGLPIAAFFVSNIYSALKGAPPTSFADALDNTFAPKTGGTSPGVGGRGTVPERAALPGNIKDIMGWWNDYSSEGKNKLGPLLKIVNEAILTGKDWQGKDIRLHEWTDVPDWVADYYNYLKNLQPISAQQLERGQKRGSKITRGESLLGIRPAPMYQQDPQGMANFLRRKRLLEQRAKTRSDIRQQNLYGGPQE